MAMTDRNPRQLKQETTDEAEWIRKHIKMRVCSHFIPVYYPKKDQDEECQCGYRYSEHNEEAKGRNGSQSPNGELKWDYTKHSEEEPTNAFGRIQFDEGNVSEYVRVSADTKMSDMLHLIQKVWGLTEPNIIFSVTGDAKGFKMSRRLKKTFRGLSPLTSGAWIVTGGTYTGVMKDVGEAKKGFDVDSKSVVSIGIATWGCIQNKNSLKQGGGSVDYMINEKQEDDSCFLDPYHTHYILVDNGTQYKYTVEIPFRAKLETEIVKGGIGEGDRSVPIVMLVLNGGLETLETVQQSIQNNTPVILVKGSGRIADILANAFENTKAEIKLKDNNLKKAHEITEELGSCDEITVKQIEKCLDNCNLISVLDPGYQSGNKEIDSVILQALFRANKDHVMDLLHLAFEWNRKDIAKREIFNLGKTGNLYNEMFSAIQLNRTDFVELFIAHSVSLPTFLTKDILDRLYKEIPPNCLLQTLLNKEKGKNDSLDPVGSVIEDLIKDLYRPSYTDRTQSGCDKQDNTTSPYEQDHDNSSKELFIWSLLMLRQDMAKLFWDKGQDSIASALVANSLLRSLKDKTNNTELVNMLECNISEWSDLAVGVLRECYATDELKAKDLLVRELSNWGNTTCMEIAVNADNIDFISQPACQSLLNRMWMRKLDEDTSSWRLFMCVLFPPLAWVLLGFQSDNEQSLLHGFEIPEVRQDGYSDDEQDENNSSEDTKSGKQVLRSTDDKDDTESKTLVQKLDHFFSAPVTLFMYSVIFNLCFLVLFTYILIFNLNRTISVEEIALMIWIFTIFLENMRKVATNFQAGKWKRYMKNVWTIFDLLAIGLSVIGFILRFQAKAFEVARVFLALSFISFCLRLLHILSVRKGLGPKLVMIGRMVHDLKSVLVILMVFVVSYAVAAHSILFPNTPLRWNTAIDVFKKSYWNIYGELFLEDILEGEPDCTHERELWIDGTRPRCPSLTGQWIVPALLGFYMLLAYILLLNLLIAMFSNTYQLVQDNTDKHWCFQRYFLIHEYTRTMLGPPFIIFSIAFLFMKWIKKKLVCQCRLDNKSSPISSDEVDDFRRRSTKKSDLEKWEKARADDFHQKTERKKLESMEYIVNDTRDILKTLTNRTDDVHLEFESRLDNLYEKIEELQSDGPLKRNIMFQHRH